MGAVLNYFIAMMIIMPLFLYVIIFIIMKRWLRNGRKARNIAINITTPFLIMSVHFLMTAIWSRSLLWLIFLVMLITAVVFTIVYWRYREEIIYSKIVIGYWRLSFLLFSFAYIILMMYGIAYRAVEAVTLF
ncbi:DUF3397 domain-containing protein [Bacillus sp. FJAT-50079]|uniref:DUF3397 domain-containing protein n=1 Tax=Bacillus sp. FJAT-50079 TaxID=2833577 RepID=UPI001BC8D9E7|nr:DUF3397 domain-containing protein [Bacillus sp. FJAT-50079]MBS4207724.1 DUF3397 domain-containing protein [Bacillus sp. FJAT-50079]